MEINMIILNVNAKIKLIIICLKHGKFEQIPYSHCIHCLKWFENKKLKNKFTSVKFK